MARQRRSHLRRSRGKYSLLASVDPVAGLAKQKMPRGFAPQGNFASIHVENPRVATRSGPEGRYGSTWQEAELHQSVGYFFGQFKSIEDGLFAVIEVTETVWALIGRTSRPLETQLHFYFSMLLS